MAGVDNIAALNARMYVLHQMCICSIPNRKGEKTFVLHLRIVPEIKP